MARQSRINGEYLHVIVRGIGKQILFEENSDRHYFLSLLQRFKDDLNIIILAYCLMENHVHLLIRNQDKTISLFMKKIGICYAEYYNKKYQRTGHLFQDRFRSEIITDSHYLLSAYRYILKNPEKAGITSADKYQWNSYSDYGKPNCLTDTSLLVSFIGSEKDFKVFMEINDNSEFMEDLPIKKDDNWALEVIKETLHTSSGTVIQKMSHKDRDSALALLKSKGISIRQLERLTGINRGIISRAV